MTLGLSHQSCRHPQCCHIKPCATPLRPYAADNIHAGQTFNKLSHVLWPTEMHTLRKTYPTQAMCKTSCCPDSPLLQQHTQGQLDAAGLEHAVAQKANRCLGPCPVAIRKCQLQTLRRNGAATKYFPARRLPNGTITQHCLGARRHVVCASTQLGLEKQETVKF